MSGRNWINRFLLSASFALSATSMLCAQGNPILPTGANVPTQGQSPVAVVNGEPIHAIELQQVLASMGPMPKDMPEAGKMHMRMQTLSSMIDEVLVRQYLKQHGPQVTQQELNAKLAEFSAELQKQGKTLNDYYKETQQTAAVVQEDLLRLTQWMKFVDARASDEVLKQYHAANRDYFDGVTVRASHIMKLTPPSMTPEAKAQAKAQLEQLSQQLIAGQINFTEAAKQHSQCPSASKGGDIGYIARKFVVEEPFAKMAFSMKPGQMSPIVETRFGYHVIYVTERKPGQPKAFEQIKPMVHASYVEEIRHSVLQQMHKIAKVQVNLQ